MVASSWSEFRAGAVAVLPAAIAVLPFGLLLGALAAQKGLSPLEVGLMSGLVFAGSAQLVALDLWREPAPWVLLGLTALTINLRHLMMGASLSRQLGQFGPVQRILGMLFLVDEIWALAERQAAQGRLHPIFYAGLATVLYASWVSSTIAGAILGPLMHDPAAWGFDFAFTAIFLSLIVAFWRGRGTALVMAASAAAAFAAETAFGGVWHVLAGGLMGMAAAGFMMRGQQ